MTKQLFLEVTILPFYYFILILFLSLSLPLSLSLSLFSLVLQGNPINQIGQRRQYVYPGCDGYTFPCYSRMETVCAWDVP